MVCFGVDGLYSGDEVNAVQTRPAHDVRIARGHAASLARRTVTADAVYLRYSPDGTAWDYLLRGEDVELVCHGPRGFDGVQVPGRGVAGWVDGAALGRP